MKLTNLFASDPRVAAAEMARLIASRARAAERAAKRLRPYQQKTPTTPHDFDALLRAEAKRTRRRHRNQLHARAA